MNYSLGSEVHRQSHRLLHLPNMKDVSWDGWLGSNWLAQMGQGQGTGKRLAEWVDRHAQVAQRRADRELEKRRLLRAVRALEGYGEPPFGEYLMRTVAQACLPAGAARFTESGLRHSMEAFDGLAAYWGNDSTIWRRLKFAWELLAVIITPLAELAQAERCGLVALKPDALQWAKAQRGDADGG